MLSRWSNIAIVLFWLATMSWLVVTKFLPPLRIGQPPDYHAILEHERGAAPFAGSFAGRRSRSAGRPVGCCESPMA